ncbi:MAG: 2-dehydropantoate 2-reductase N-terminal domain-containing protein [Candidatus Dormiibacterota bacterium]
MERIVIWGAGAIGGVVGAWLAHAGLDPLLVDQNADHVAAMRERGLTITGTRGSFTQPVRASTPDEVQGPLETVYLAVKCPSTPGALEAIAPRLAAESRVVSLQNGLNELVIGERIGVERTIGCFVHFSADWQSPGVIEHGGEHPIFVGELDGRSTPRLEEIRSTLATFGETVATDNVWGYLWSKLGYASLLFATALIDAPIYDTLRAPDVGPTLYRLVQESLSVPDRLGVRLEDIKGFQPGRYRGDDWRPAIEDVATFYEGQIKVKTGIWRDLAVRHRPTEVDCQIGALARRGRELGLSMPRNERLVALIHELEAGTRPMALDNVGELAMAGDAASTT